MTTTIGPKSEERPLAWTGFDQAAARKCIFCGRKNKSQEKQEELGNLIRSQTSIPSIYVSRQEIERKYR